jgi:uncharacterized coiled-coil protein SlyX
MPGMSQRITLLETRLTDAERRLEEIDLLTAEMAQLLKRCARDCPMFHDSLPRFPALVPPRR